MYKLSVPISMRTVNDRTMPIYLDWFQKCRADRVFLCGFGEIFSEESVLYQAQFSHRGKAPFRDRKNSPKVQPPNHSLENM